MAARCMILIHTAIAVRCGCGSYFISNIAAVIAVDDCNLKPWLGEVNLLNGFQLPRATVQFCVWEILGLQKSFNLLLLYIPRSRFAPQLFVRVILVLVMLCEVLIKFYV